MRAVYPGPHRASRGHRGAPCDSESAGEGDGNAGEMHTPHDASDPPQIPAPRVKRNTTTRDRHRGTRQERGYDAAHDRLRADYQRRMDRGEAFTCWRCDDPINPEHWHLGHDDHDRSVYRGPECVPCNTATRGRRPPQVKQVRKGRQHPGG